MRRLAARWELPFTEPFRFQLHHLLPTERVDRQQANFSGHNEKTGSPIVFASRSGAPLAPIPSYFSPYLAPTEHGQRRAADPTS